MKRDNRLLRQLLSASCLFLAFLPAEAEDLQGIVVESIAGWALEDAGIQEGDVLLSWIRLPNPPTSPEAAEGDLITYFDWLELKMEQAPRGRVVLAGWRGGEPKEFLVEPGLWRAEVRPLLPRTVEGAYHPDEFLDNVGALEIAIKEWGMLAGHSQEASENLRFWVTLKAGQEWEKQGELKKAAELYREALASTTVPVHQMAIALPLGKFLQTEGALDEAEAVASTAWAISQGGSSDSLFAAAILNRLGGVALARGDLDFAKESFSKALQLRESLAPGGLEVAASLNDLGALARFRGKLEVAHELHQRALKIREEMAPNSLEIAMSLSNLGIIAWARGQLDEAQEYHLRALAISIQLESEGSMLASVYGNLGIVNFARGNLAKAQEYFQQALPIQEALGAQNNDLAKTLGNLGLIARARGDLERAEEYYGKALAIFEHNAPDGLDAVAALRNLGVLYSMRAEHGRAHEYYSRALRIHQERSPESRDMVASLVNLAEATEDLGDREKAKEYLASALRIAKKVDPLSLEMASALGSFSGFYWRSGEIDLAEEYLRKALEIRKQVAPKSLEFANALNNMGLVYKAQGKIELARDCLLQASQIREQLVPGSLAYAETLANLGSIAQLTGEPAEAFRLFSASLKVLDSQVSNLGGSYNVRASFRAHHADFFHEMFDFLINHGALEEAFHLLESFRARTFLAMLAERDTVFSMDIPEKVEEERRLLAVHYDRTLSQLGRLNLRDHSSEIAVIRQKLGELINEAGDLEARIRRLSPRLAALQYPRALTSSEVQAVLDPGTLLLSYRVGEKNTTLFSLSQSGELEVMILPITRALLRSQIEDLRGLVRDAVPGSSLGKWRLQRFYSLSRSLYSTLLEPVAGKIADNERLLIVPDGPLNVLPFAALVHDEVEENRMQYLVEAKPFHIALSATVYAELQQERHSNGGRTRPQASLQLAAFGNPLYPTEIAVAGEDYGSRGDVVVRSALERGFLDLQPLPYTRHEVQSIASLFPQQAVRTFLGAEALEERIKGLERETHILHLAAHGYIDEHLPMNSFIAVTVPEDILYERSPMQGGSPGGDNGLLQVWEIFEDVRINADLVVLSACDSGLGQELGGEGLIGLTRAFQYAGARSVVASLWSVADQTTAELMIRFYRHLRSGLPKAEALRAAQLELIKGPIEVEDKDGKILEIDASAPYYWAAFQLYGHWQ